MRKAWGYPPDMRKLLWSMLALALLVASIYIGSVLPLILVAVAVPFCVVLGKVLSTPLGSKTSGPQDSPE